VHYLRSLRLNIVRRRLMATRQTEVSVSQAAADQGFIHLGHFTERYKLLFREMPSETLRVHVPSDARAKSAEERARGRKGPH
jgi:AraC family ethanolamine operon transcriptional activator